MIFFAHHDQKKNRNVLQEIDKNWVLITFNASPKHKHNTHTHKQTNKHTHLPSSDTRDDQYEWEGDHTKGHHQPNLQQVLWNSCLVLSIESRSRLQAKRITHGYSTSLQAVGKGKVRTIEIAVRVPEYAVKRKFGPGILVIVYCRLLFRPIRDYCCSESCTKWQGPRISGYW